MGLLYCKFSFACLLMNVVFRCTAQSLVVDGRRDEVRNVHKRTLLVGVVPQVTSIEILDTVRACSVLSIATIDNNVTVNLATLNTTSITIVAKTTSDVESVKFGLNSNDSFHIESTDPYSMCGNDGMNLVHCPWIDIGTHTIRLTPYSIDSAGGIAGNTVTVSIVNIPSCRIPKVRIDISLICIQI